MNKWYIVYMASRGQEFQRIGPFDTKGEAVMHWGVSSTKRSGSLYHHPRSNGYIGRKKDFLSEGFDWAFPEGD